MEQITVINLKGFSSSQFKPKTYEVFKNYLTVMQAFPEMVYRCVLVNAPGVFTLIWKIIRKVLDRSISSKIAIFSNSEDGRKYLLELIGEEEVPSNYGGNALSTIESMVKLGRGRDLVVRQLVELVRMKSKTEVVFEFDLDESEQCRLVLYTRSTHVAEFSISNKANDEVLRVMKYEQGLTVPCCVEIEPELKGPGSFRLLGKPLLSTGSWSENFLIVGDISLVESINSST